MSSDLLSGAIQAAPVYLMAGLFFLRARTLARQGRPIEPWRPFVFALAMLVVLVAELPPIGTLSDERLSFHMVEHLMIGDLAAILMAVALTGPMLRPVLTAPVLRRLRWLTHPLVAVPLWVVVYYGWHVPTLYDAAVRHDLVHALEHATMLGAGLALWLGLFGPLPKPAWFGDAAALVYTFVVRLAGAAIANVFIWSDTIFYPHYEQVAQDKGINAVADQSTAGAIWMLEGSVVTVGVLGWVFARWMSRAEAAQQLVELAQERGVELDPKRARRAVASGTDQHLRERIEQGPRAPASG